MNNLYQYLNYDYSYISKLPYENIIDINNDTKSKDKKKIIVDLIGLLGLCIIIISYLFNIFYIIKYKKIQGMPYIYVIIRFFGFCMILLYGYIKNYINYYIIKIVLIFSIITYFIFFIIFYNFL